MIKEKNDIEEILNKTKSFLVVSHDMPDGDAIGSVLAVGKALENLNKDVILFIGDEIPDKYHFMYGSDKIITDGEISYIPPVLFVLDCGDLSRVKLKKEFFSKKTIVNIDHHLSNSYFGDINIIDINACATGEIIFKLFKELNIEIDLDIATAIYTAILTDTGSFRFSNSTPDSHLIAAELIKSGVKPEKISREIYEKRSIEGLKILSKALECLNVSKCGNYAWTFITKEMLAETGAVESDLEGIINYVREIKGVEIGILFKQVSDSVVKVGFRSNEWVDVRQLAVKFSGGGHKRASGCLIRGKLGDVINLVLKEVEKYF